MIQPMGKKSKTTVKWTVLCDNRTQDASLETEHGLSIYLETGGLRLLLDTGTSDLFMRNAERLGVDLSTVDYVFISHGHSDHAGGLKYLAPLNNRLKVIVSPAALTGTFISKRNLAHSITTTWPEMPAERLITVGQSCQIADDMHVIACIPHQHAMPLGNLKLFIQDEEGQLTHDDFRHELALYVNGLLFTGCAHSGLENILSACPWPIHTVIGGFHLLDGYESEEELIALATTLKEKYPQTQFFTSHCTGDNAFVVLKRVMGEQIQAFSCGKTAAY